MFPGGSVSHHIEIKEGKDGGFVHMFGPIEVGGSHGTVGFGGGGKPDWASSPGGLISAEAKYVGALVWGVAARLPDPQNGKKSRSIFISGKIVVTGFPDGMDSSGNTNTTLQVAYKLEGLGNLNCTEVGNCLRAELKDRFNNCDEVEIEIEQLENDEPEDTDVTAAEVEGDGDETNNIILKIQSLLENVDEAGVIEGVKYINIGKSIAHFFNKTVTLNRHDGKILGCSTFTEVTSDAEASSGGDGDNAVLSTSGGAGKSFGALLTISVFVSSVVVLITSL